MKRSKTKAARKRSKDVGNAAPAIATAAIATPATPAEAAPSSKLMDLVRKIHAEGGKCDVARVPSSSLAAAAAPAAPKSDLEEALEVKKRAFTDLEDATHVEVPKFVDAYSRAANVVRQLEKDRKKAVSSFSDDEIIEYIRELPERRREAVLTAARGADRAGKPLFP
jgi:hypothetical protein